MRNEARIKMGFYPCPVPVVELLATRLEPPAKPYAMLDPCAGVGEALQTLSVELDRPKTGVSSLYAIELDEQRAEKLRENLDDVDDHVLAPASFFGCSIKAKSFSLIWLNPPFDDEIGGGVRVEHEFLETATNLLQPKGVLVFIVPQKTAALAYLRDVLETWYDNVAMIPFPAEHRKYNEVAIVAVKRSDMIDPWHRGEEEVYQPLDVYPIPSGKGPGHRFDKTDMTDGEWQRAFAESPLLQHLQPPPEPPLPSPPMALSKGHLALLLSAGYLDGLVEPDGEPPHVVRGKVEKVKFVSDVEENELSDGRLQMKTTYSERIKLTVRVVGADGEIKTFTDVGGPIDDSATA